MRSKWFKDNPTDEIWWKDDGRIGTMVFSFDKKREYNYFTDLDQLTTEQRAIFDKYDPMNPQNYASPYREMYQ